MKNLSFLLLLLPYQVSYAVPRTDLSSVRVGLFSGVMKSATGIMSGSATSSDLPEGSNLYYTNGRSQDAISGTAPVVLTSGVVSMAASTNSVNGYLTSTDHTTYSAKFGTVTYTPSTPSRTLNSNFTPSASVAVSVCYSIKVACTSTLISSCEGNVELRSDTNATPTTARGRSGIAISGVAATNATESTLCYLVPPNHNVRLVSTTVSGSPTVTLGVQSEVSVAFTP